LALLALALGSGTARSAAPPLPIPGGQSLPDGTLLHLFSPGPPSLVLPFSKTQAMGRNADPTTITNFRGSTALAYLVGSVRSTSGKRYNLEVDIRAFRGTYVAADGSRHRGLFGFI
jgi:hypothetical protein